MPTIQQRPVIWRFTSNVLENNKSQPSRPATGRNSAYALPVFADRGKGDRQGIEPCLFLVARERELLRGQLSI